MDPPPVIIAAARRWFRTTGRPLLGQVEAIPETMKLDGLSIPMTMGDWALIIESISERLEAMDNMDAGSMDEDVLADLYTFVKNAYLAQHPVTVG